MAIMKPKKQRTDRIESTGGGAGRSLGGVRGITISKNVRVVGPKGTSVKPGKLTEGAAQARTQNITRANIKPGKANAKALKAANGKLSKGNAKRAYDKDKVEMIMKYNPKDTKADAERWAPHPGYASQKSNTRLQKGKWSSEKQIARYQKAEIKDFRKPKKSK